MTEKVILFFVVRSSAAAAADRIAALRAFHCDVLPHVVSQGDKPKLDADLRVGPEAEAFEALVELDVSEDGFRFDRPVAGMIQTPPACLQPSCLYPCRRCSAA